MTRRRSYLLRVRWLCPIQIRKWWLCFPGPPTGSGSCGILHRVLNPQGWTIGFSGWHELVLSHPPRFLSSRRCMKSSLVRGRHLLLPETAPVGPPPSPPLMAVRLRVTHASPMWSGPWLCSCALTPPGAGSRLSLPGPVSTRRTLPAGLTRPVGKPRVTPCDCPRSRTCSNSLHPSGAMEPVVGGVPNPSRPPPRGAAKPRARGPRTGDPEMIGTALQEMVTAPLLPPEEGWVVNPLFFPSVPPRYPNFQ